ncbi:HAMP domain-containing protein, partial [Pseudomonas aeruginosa]|uniref:HAMP domain-containing protein n=1 Tax=Pseudomonas aeruginosa TaxID=287 RepID=UPI0039A38807
MLANPAASLHRLATPAQSRGGGPPPGPPRGSLDTRVEVRGGDSVGRLGAAFNH